MPPISRSYWFDSITELKECHGDDIEANGSGASFLLEDVVFTYYNGELYMYICIAYEVAESSDIPRSFTGPERTGFGFPYFIWVDLDYTTTGLCLPALSFNLISTSDDYGEVAKISEEILTTNPTPMLAFRENVAYDLQRLESNPTDLNEADYVEESGGKLNFTSSGVKFDTIGAAGNPFALVGTDTLSGPNMSYLDNWHAGPNNSIRHFLYGYKGQNVQIFEVDHSDGSVSQVGSVSVLTTGVGSLPGELRPVTSDAFVTSHPYYTGSKTEQGRLFYVPINTDFSFGTVQTIESPIPTRNGNLGLQCGLAVVDDSTHGEDTHIITSNDDEIVFLRESNSFATFHQVIVMDRNDYLVKVAGGRNYAWIVLWDDSANSNSWRGFYFNGTTWSQVYSATANVSILTLKFIDDDLLVHRYSSVSMQTYRVTSTGATQVWHMPTNTGYGACYHSLKGFIWGHGLFTSLVDLGTSRDYYVHEINVTTGQVTYNLGKYNQDPELILRMFQIAYEANGTDVAFIFLGSTAEIQYIWGDPTTGDVEFDTGHYYFTTTADSRIVIPDGVDSIFNGSLDATIPVNSEIRVAVSVDNGSTWMAYDSINTDIEYLSSLADIKTLGSDRSDLDTILHLLDLSVYKNIDVAVAMNRPATVAADETPIVESIWIQYTPAIGVKTTLLNGTNNVGIYYRKISSNALQVSVGSGVLTILRSNKLR